MPADGNIQNTVVFPVRERRRASEILYVLPTADYEAYNLWGCKSLYFDACGGANTIAGDPRAVAVSFDRPQAEGNGELNRFFGPDYNTVFWLEQQGYDVTYTDDIQTDSNLPGAAEPQGRPRLGPQRVLVLQLFQQLQESPRRRREHRLAERQHRLLADPLRKQPPHAGLLQDDPGTRSGNPGGTPNDPACDRAERRNPAAVRDHHAARPRRSRGRPERTAAAGGSGPNEPENSLWGEMYVGDNDSLDFQPDDPRRQRERRIRRTSRVWRNTGISRARRRPRCPTRSSAGSGTRSRPSPAYLAQEPAGVKQLTPHQHAPKRRLLAAGRGTRARQHSAGRRAEQRQRGRVPRHPAARWFSPAARWSGPAASTPKKPP